MFILSTLMLRGKKNTSDVISINSMVNKSYSSNLKDENYLKNCVFIKKM